ncbi:MAG: iron transporter, partial [Hydrogenophaga sp.]|nr:iron transporter [Hydrogenophaga sp.]
MNHPLLAIALAGAVLFSLPSHAKEFPIGTPHKVAGMEIAAVYLAPVKMEPEGMMRKAEASDIHLEADIHALKDHLLAAVSFRVNLVSASSRTRS